MREFQTLYFLVGVASEARIEKNSEKYWISKIKRNLVLKYNIIQIFHVIVFNIQEYYIWCGFRTISLAKSVTWYTEYLIYFFHCEETRRLVSIIKKILTLCFSFIGWVSGNIIDWGAKPTVSMLGLWPEVNDLNHSATQALSVSNNVYKFSIISVIRCNAT